MDLPIKKLDGDFPYFFVCLPGRVQHHFCTTDVFFCAMGEAMSEFRTAVHVDIDQLTIHHFFGSIYGK